MSKAYVIDDLPNWKLAAEASGFQFTCLESRLAGGMLCVEHVAWDGQLRPCGVHLSFPERKNVVPSGYIMEAGA